MFKVNEYFDGRVTSIAFKTEALPATIGVMAVGDYEFDTKAKEYMTVVSGRLSVILPNHTQWRTFKTNDVFELPANSKFQVRAEVETAYLCLYEA